MAVGIRDTGSDLYDNKAGYIRAGVIPCLIVAILSTLLRLYSRRISNKTIDTSDYLIIAATLSSICIGTLVFVEINYGFGRHVQTVSPSDLETFLKIFFAAEIFYVTTITCTKIGLLSWYCTIFNERRFKLAAKLIGAVVLAWATACVFGVIFSCVPVSAFWDLSLRPHARCIDTRKFFNGNAIPNIMTDVAILALPVSSVWKLHMSWQKKLMVSGMFLLGSFVVVCSTFRLTLIYHRDLNDVTYGLVWAFTWSNIEINVAIVSANLPTYAPLLARVRQSHTNSKLKHMEMVGQSDETYRMNSWGRPYSGNKKTAKAHNSSVFSMGSASEDRETGFSHASTIA